MKKLTNTQINYIINDFFVGSRNDEQMKQIAFNLLTSGKCYVGGESCIWSGGVGNFIKINKPDLFVNCCEYVFNLEDFLSSQWFKMAFDDYIKKLREEKNKIEEEYFDVLGIKIE